MEEKIKKPIYKRWWFIIIVIVVLLIGVGSALGGGSDDTTAKSDNDAKTEEQAKTPTAVTADKLVTTLEDNALNAADTYEGKYVKLTGRLDVIDASGDYFSLYPMDDEWAVTGVQCFIDEEHLDQVKAFKEGQKVTVIGTITDVGEILGYSLDVESIK